MPLNLHIPLPGPFSWTAGLGGAIGGKGLFTLLMWLFVGPLVLCAALVWGAAVLVWGIIALVLKGALLLVGALLGAAKA